MLKSHFGKFYFVEYNFGGCDLFAGLPRYVKGFRYGYYRYFKKNKINTVPIHLEVCQFRND